MMKPNTINKPEAKVLTYSLNAERGWYSQTTAPPGFTKVPDELRVEDTQRTDKIKSDTIIRSRQVNGKRPFFTGLRPTKFIGLFYGDHSERRPNGDEVKSFILFHFTEDSKQLTVHFFNSYKVYSYRIPTFVSNYWLSK
jgi:hypothetical protein